MARSAFTLSQELLLAGRDYLVLKRASASRPSGEWNEDDYDVLAGGDVVGRIFRQTPRPWERRGCRC
jgi:hypothetical protein